MRLLGSLLAGLGLLVQLAQTNIYGNNTVWNISNGDQVAFPLYRLFGSNKDYSLKYSVIANFTTKLVSREPFCTREVAPGCKALTSMDLAEKEDPNKLTMICGKNEFYEMGIESGTGKITDSKLLAKFDGQECLASDWSKAINSYAVFCLQGLNATSAADKYYVVNMVDRATGNVIGTSKLQFSELSSYQFNERIKVRFRQVPKGTTTATVVTVFDEPYSDKDVTIVSKANSFFLLAEIDTTTKKPEELLQAVKFSSDVTLMREKFFKGMTMEIIGNNVHVIFYSHSQALKVGKCTLDITTAKAARLTGCLLRENTVQIGFGAMSFMNITVAYFNKREKEFFACRLNTNDQDPNVPAIEKCNKLESRTGRDIDIRDFASLNETNLKVYYMTNDTRIELGVDVHELAVGDPKPKLVDRFNSYCNSTVDIKRVHYTISESFLDVYDKTRAEELLLQGHLVPIDRGVPLTVVQEHYGSKDTREIQIHQFPRFIQAITPRSSFPALVGFKGNFFKVPIGREYFSGNGINFELKGDLSSKLVSNAGDIEFVVDGENAANIHAYYHTNGYATMMMTDNKILIVNCARKLQTNFVMKCAKIGEKFGMNVLVNETVIATYHTQHLMVIVTSYGQFIFFNKVAHTSDVLNLQGDSRFIKQVVFKPKDSFILISVLVADSKGEVSQISNFMLNEFARIDGSPQEVFFYSVSNITKASYKAETNQENAGEFCPKTIAYEVVDTPFLDVLNACATKDRRIFRFSMKDERNPEQISNSFIRVNELKNDQIQMCPDLDTVTVASIGSNQAVGIGYESFNIKLNLGLKELGVQKLTKLVCLGNKAFAMGLLTIDGKFLIATYFTGKLRLANDRLHSILEFEASQGYQDFTGAESDGYIFYNVMAAGKRTLFRMINLEGPEFFVKSSTRSEVSDALVGCSNGVSNFYAPLPISFREQRNTVQVGSRAKNVELNAQTYDVGQLVSIVGPVFHYNIESDVTAASITPRVSQPKEYIPTADISTFKSLFFSKIKILKDYTFILSQMPSKSQILLKYRELNTPVVRNFVLNQTCHNFDVIEETDNKIGFVVALSCFYRNEKRIHFVNISLDGRVTYQGFSSVNISTKDLGLTFTSTPSVNNYRYMLANLDETNHLTLYKFNFSTSADKLNAQISFNSIVHTVSNVNVMKVITTPNRINVMYFTPKDHKGNVFVIENKNLTLVSSTHSTVVTTDFTVMAMFDCQFKLKSDVIQQDYVDCVFATHGPFVFRVQLKEDPGTGLVEVTNSPLKGRYEMFFDNIAIKLTFNDNFFALLSTSISAGKHRILIYKFTDKGGSRHLWSGIRLDEYSKRPLEDLDLAIQPNNELIFATNSFETTQVVSLAKSVMLSEAQLTVKKASLLELSKFKIKFNDGQVDIAQSYVPLSNFFMHVDEQTTTVLFKASRWYHWVLSGVIAAAIYGYLFYRWKYEVERRQKLREEVLCNNLGDELRV